MPDEVRCASDSSHAFTCEVFIGPDVVTPSAPSTANGSNAATTSSGTNAPGAAAEQTASPTQRAAVSTLVQSYKQIALPEPDVPYVTGKALLACGGSELSILLAGVAKGPFAPIVAFKAGYDTGKCLAGELNSASAAAGLKEAADDCAAQGGTVTGVNDNRSFCEVPVSR